MDDVKCAAEEFRNMARQTTEAGIPLGLHSENFEISKVDGKRTYCFWKPHKNTNGDALRVTAG